MDRCRGRAGLPACRNWGQINLHATQEEGWKKEGRQVGGRQDGWKDEREGRKEGRDVGRER